MSMGGGGGGGGAVVQSTDPKAAYLAGHLGADAALQASQLASGQIQTAIKSLNDSYRAATASLRPYTQTGIEYLDKLNQYLGADPYRPAKAPDAPTLENLAAKITPSQARDYIMQNMQLGNNPGSKVKGVHYSGYGTEGSDPKRDWWSNLGDVPVNEQSSIAAAQQLFADPNIAKLSRIGAAKEQLAGAEEQYAIDKANYDQQMMWAEKYGTPLTTQQISENISNQPGYQAELEQGIDAIAKNAAARGYIGSGAILKDLSRYGQGTMSKYYGEHLSRLAAMVGAGQQASTSLAGLQSNQGQQIASLYGSLGDIQANAQLSAGNSLMNAMITANQKFDVVGGGDSGGGGMAGIGQALGGIGSLVSAFSSKKLKDHNEKVSKADILERVNQLDIEKWRYKDIPVTHIGPYAEQFKEVFGVGDGRSINLIDAVGILLASVQELSRKLDEVKK